MDPITIIVTALAAGATAGLKPTAEQAVKDAYAGIKTLIQRKYQIRSMESLEQKPDSETKRTSVKEDLTEAGAGDDKELLDRAKFLLDTVQAHDPQVAAKLNIKFDEVEAAYFKLRAAAAKGGINVEIKKSTFIGGIDMEGLTAGTPQKKK